MKFCEFLSHQKISKSRVARELGRARSYISDISNEKIRPGRVLAEEIYKWSKGAVTFYDFYPELNPDKVSSPDKGNGSGEEEATKNITL
jgi:hypothetical protein